MAKMIQVFKINEIEARKPRMSYFSPENLEAAIIRLERAIQNVSQNVGQDSQDPDTQRILKTAQVMGRLISEPKTDSMEKLYRTVEAHYSNVVKSLNNITFKARNGQRGEPLEAQHVNEFSQALYHYLQVLNLGAQEQDNWSADDVGFNKRR